MNDFNANKYTCFGCGKQGHIKEDFPNNENKEKTKFKGERRGKTKKVYVAWDDNEVSSSSSSEYAEAKGERRGESKKAYVAWDDNEVSSSSSSLDAEANLCLKASTSSSVSSYSLSKGDNYYQFLEAFKETHVEENKVGFHKQ